jgi:hypothetical protein
MAFFLGVFFFGMGIGLEISYKSKSLYPFLLVKIGTSTLHLLPHLPIHLHIMHLERLKMHSYAKNV